MGCLLGCFGGAKDRKQRRKQRNKVLPRDNKHSHGCSFSHQNDALSEQKKTHGCSVSRPNDALSEQMAIESSPISLVELQDNKSEEKSSSSSGSKKRVTFNSNVKTYEHVSPLYESRDSLPETLKSLTDEEIEQLSAKVKQSLSSCEENSAASSVGSYPPNYRYQNCRDSDDEIEECCDDDSDLDDDDNGDDYEEEEDYFDDDDGNGDHHAFDGQEEWSELIVTASIESRTENLSAQPTNKEVKNDAEMLSGTDKDTGNVRVRSAYVQPVLNPVENLTRWKSVNTRCESELTPQKENISLTSETDTCPSFEPIVKRSSSNLKPKSGRYDKPTNEEVAVDASLSTWLSSSSKTNARESVCSENSSKSQSSKYIRNNLEDRPILGALTVDELKEISKYSSSPRKSPSRSPDEMPIIGSVGSYWNDAITEKDSRSVSSYKGFPNTNKKYSEDKKVNWHSTPFEKRLERALNQRSGDA